MFWILLINEVRKCIYFANQKLGQRGVQIITEHIVNVLVYVFLIRREGFLV